MQRRDFLKGAAAVAALPLLPRGAVAQTGANPATLQQLRELRQQFPLDALVTHEPFWQHIRSFYALPSDVIQLENGNWGAMSLPVLQAYTAHTAHVNRLTSYHSRRELGGELRPIMAQLAQLLGCNASELALARGASEVLNNLISGYRLLEAKNAVMYADVDYDSMQAAMRQRGVEVIALQLPEQASTAELIEHYRQALQRHPQVKLLLLTHVSHRHGLVLPIKQIVAMAREYEVDCIVDAAHSWGQLDFNLADLGADFVGFNLHKWIGAPLGCGLMFIRRERLADIAPALGEGFAFEPSTAIGQTYHRVHTGTTNYAAWLSIPAALDFHSAIGAELKAARIKYLRDYWVQQVEALPQVQVVAETGDPGRFAGITSLRLRGQTDTAANQALAQRLLNEQGIFTVHRTGLAAGACVRVTPSIFNTQNDITQLVAALRTL